MVAVPYDYQPFAGAVIAFMVLQIVAVIGRIYIRIFLVKAFGKDDIACIFTLILATAFDCSLIALWRLSNLDPIWDVPYRNILPVIKLVLASETIYIVATMALKISLGLLLLRVLVKRWMRWVIYVTLMISVAFGTVYFFVVLFQCGNPADFPARILLGQCLALDTINGLSYTHAALTATADLVFGALPVIFLWDAAFSRRAKISVGAILVLGSVGCICTFIRIGWIHYLTAATLTYLVTSKGIAITSVIELSIGLLCVSLATYRPLVHRYIHRRDTSYYYDENSQVDAQFASQHGMAQEMMPAHSEYALRSHRSSQHPPKHDSTDAVRLWKAASLTDTASVESDPWRVPLSRGEV